MNKQLDFLVLLLACALFVKSPGRLYKCLLLANKKTDKFNEEIKDLLRLFDLPEDKQQVNFLEDRYE